MFNTGRQSITGNNERELDMITLGDQERRALKAFLDVYWNEFKQTAQNFLSDDEIEALGDTLDVQ